jgi:ubiquinol-cytochrome c reductase cytochrome b subunit
VGWLEGALRIFPSWEIRAFGHTVPNPFFPAVLLPGVTFLILYLWPFLEQHFTGDREPHNLLDLPHHHPFRTAVGAGALAFYTVLFFAASNDLIARLFHVSVTGVTWAFRILVVVLPVVVFAVVHRLMKAVVASGEATFTTVPLRAFLGRSERRPGRPEEDGAPGPVTHELPPADELSSERG